MENWFNRFINLINSSFEDTNQIDYRYLIHIFYDYFSNRNLAKVIAYIYAMDEIIVYFDIDTIISNKDFMDKNKMDYIMQKLNDNGFENWVKLLEVP